MSSLTNNSKQKRIGKAAFKVILEKALESIPIYGIVFVTGYKVYDAIKQELEKDRERELTKAEILQAVGTLTHAETQEAVDQILSSPKGLQATKKLNSTELAQARKQLLQLPSEFDQILASIEARERTREDEAVISNQRKQENVYLTLQEDLKRHLEHEQLGDAYHTVQEMLVLKPNDQVARKVCRFLYSRRAYKAVAKIGIKGFIGTWSLLVSGTVTIPTIFNVKFLSQNTWTLIAAESLIALIIVTRWQRFSLGARKVMRRFFFLVAPIMSAVTIILLVLRGPENAPPYMSVLLAFGMALCFSTILRDEL